jgi:hypothetical protein
VGHGICPPETRRDGGTINRQGRERVERSEAMHVDALSAAGVVLQQQRNHTKTELIDFAKNNRVDLHEDRALDIPGWQGQPKSLKQFCGNKG